MEERMFTNQAIKPTEQTLHEAFENVYPCYEKIINCAKSYLQEWVFTKSGGWMLKVFDRKKALFYLIPFRNQFNIDYF